MTRAWRTSMGELKLNLGCGRNVLPRFVNIDTSPSVLLNRWPFAKKILFSIGLINREQFATTWRPNIIWREVSRGLPYPDNSGTRYTARISWSIWSSGVARSFCARCVVC